MRPRARQRGTAAIEFAIVVPVFLALMLSTFEAGWYYFVNSMVDAATVNVARYIRTGQAQNAGYLTQANRDDFFHNIVCPRLSFLGDCDTRLTAEVTTFNTFADLAADTTPPTCRDDTPAQIAAVSFQPGLDDAIVRVRLCFIYKTLNPLIGLNLSRTSDGQRKVIASYILRVEPFSKNINGP
ncbi:MAG TPA: TadE/TadG family type IV pilus assembly protein [Parvularculaceae bacterium]|nr:TadE/TadG family type IV pilus assembly protein [Parvularculaceae bacterium]